MDLDHQTMFLYLLERKTLQQKTLEEESSEPREGDNRWLENYLLLRRDIRFRKLNIVRLLLEYAAGKD